MKEVLRNPHRQRILQLLVSRKVLTPKEIAKELKIGVPTVYYHLELLGDCVQKTSRGEYSVTEKGIAVYRSEIMNASSKSSGMPVLYSTISLLIARPFLAALLGLVAASLELAVCYRMGFIPFMLGYRPVLETSALPVYYAASIFLAFAVLEAASYALNRRLGGEVPLLTGVLLSRLPLMIVLVLALAPLDGPSVAIAVTAVSQLLSILVLSIFLSLSKGIRQEISIILGLVLLYLNLLVYSSVQL
ncbi:MAG: helix-turn-helix domain-containing protein [Candidatus Methanosuratincola petrocarbonis]